MYRTQEQVWFRRLCGYTWDASLVNNRRGTASLPVVHGHSDSDHEAGEDIEPSTMSSQREFERKMEEHIEEMRVTQTIAYFSRTVELCFSECVHSFRSKKLDDKELSCVSSCAEKFLRHTMRSSVRLQESYADIMEQQQQQQQSQQ